MNAKVKSFTIVELLVVMVLSSIVILLALSFYTSVYKSFYKLTDDMEESNRIYSFINQMNNDFEKADVVDYHNYCYNFMDNDKAFVCYYFENKDIIIRSTDNYNDTLFVNYRNIDTTCINNPNGNNYIEKLIFEINIDKKWMEVLLAKEYYSKALFNLESIKR
jgi:hypothetical protein